MTYLLDTNAAVDYLRAGSGSGIAGRILSLPPGEVVICSVVLAELLYGAERSRDSAAQRASIMTLFGHVPSLPFDDAAADEYSRIRVDLARLGTPIGPYDLQIAAIALANDLTLVTHNTGEFSRVAGLKLDDWQ